MCRAHLAAPRRRRIRLAALAGIAASGLATDAHADLDSLSADGKKVAFISDATNLPGANGHLQVYLRNLVSGRTRLVSTDSSGSPGDSTSFGPVISADGRRVAFNSHASNLDPGDTGWGADVFVHNLRSGRTELVSVHSDGSNGSGWNPSISADGRKVAFESGSTNLVGGDGNGTSDVFVHNLRNDRTRRVSVDSSGSEGNGYSQWPSISADGRRVAFRSEATNLVGGDGNGTDDIFVHNLRSGKTQRVSVASDGSEADFGSRGPSISADGRRVAFGSRASNLVGGDGNAAEDVFVHNLRNERTRRVSVDSSGGEGDGDSRGPSISAGGRRVAFDSEAPNLVPGDSNGVFDIFVHKLRSGKTQRVSVDSSGTEGSGASPAASIAADGRSVAFYSEASNLVPGDTNGAFDVFLHDLRTGATERVSLRSNGAEAKGESCLRSCPEPP